MEAKQELSPQKEEILQLADSMAAAAASFNAHGYDSFIQARQTLCDKIKNCRCETCVGTCKLENG